MSQDPKKPFDAPPGQTPELLQQEIPLDRRNRRVPTFEELRAQAPTDPDRPAHPRPSTAPTERVPRPQAIPQATVPARSPAAPAQPRPPARPAASEQTNVLPPHAPPSDEGVRTIPPSPAEWARMRGQSQPLPQVTAGIPSRGASMPPGQASTPARAQPAHTAPPARSQLDTVPERPTEPARAPVPKPQPAPQRPVGPSYQSLPSVLPPEMLVTQPGMPGPFADNKRVAYQPQPPPPEAAPAARAPEPEPEPVSRRAPAGPSSLADFAAMGEPRAQRGDVMAAPASVWRRVAAWLVDVALLAAVVTAMLVGAAQVIAGGLTLQKLPAIFVPAVLLTALLAFVYASLFAFVWGGRSPGRRILGLHLVDGSGHAPSPGRALLRGVLSLVSFGLFLAGFWMALFDRRGQTLHDKLSSTFVVQLRDA